MTSPVVYSGRPPHDAFVTTAGVRVPLTHRVRHSPTGFSWGYQGSGPADLARSILWDALGTEPSASQYQPFKRVYVARWPGDQPWYITRDEVRSFVLRIMQSERLPNGEIDRRAT